MKNARFLRLLPALVLLVLVGSTAYKTFWSPNNFAQRREIIFTVSRGFTFRAITDSLEAAGIIENKTFFQLAGRILGWTKEMKVGKYAFEDGVSNYEILLSLHSGKSAISMQVAIPEGSAARQVAKILTRLVGIDSTLFMNMVHSESFAEELGVEGNTLEGYLLPDTYQFYWQMDESEIVRKMVGELQKFYTDSLKNRAAELGLTTGEVLTMASIVEGEALIDSERAIIAGVYYNRLKKGMRLEADPTIQYLLSDGPRRLLYSDLAIVSPYNTYLNKGLPPSPIGNPGRKSIVAALWPASHQYFYFVSDGMGGHVFSKTYEEHQRAVRAYRRLRDLAAVRETSG